MRLLRPIQIHSLGARSEVQKSVFCWITNFKNAARMKSILLSWISDSKEKLNQVI
jgi:hypothetical protein